MRSEKIWVQQCRATKGIKRRFGAKSALGQATASRGAHDKVAINPAKTLLFWKGMPQLPYRAVAEASVEGALSADPVVALTT
jgi:hypothetical protein